MKKVVIMICALLAATLVSCTYTEKDIALARTSGFDAGYIEGHDDGYSEGFDDGRTDGYEDGRQQGHSDVLAALEEAGMSYWQQQLVEFLAEKEEKQDTEEPRKPVELPKPASGTILSGGSYSGSEITVTADSTCDYVVSLKTVEGTERVTFYVRAGDTVTVGTPAEYLYIYFASGTEWYGLGEGRMFGDNTAYSKDDELQDFTQYTWEYTLYPVTNGNFSETPSDEGEFFG